MTQKKKTLAPLCLCTTIALLTSPAFAHDGPHHMTYLQSMLHELAYADYLAAAFVLAATGVVTTMRLCRHRREAVKK